MGNVLVVTINRFDVFFVSTPHPSPENDHCYVTHKKNNGKKIPFAMIQLTLPPGKNEKRKQLLCRLPRVVVTKKTKQS
jgi:hypothetical protein